MRRSLVLFAQHGKASLENLIQITHGSFLQQESAGKGTANAPLFQDLSFLLPAGPLRHDEATQFKQQHWAVIGASGTTTFLEILRGTHLCSPPNARSFPYLASDEIGAKDHKLRSPSRAIQYVGFNGGKGGGLGGGIRGAYLSARYESRREDDDWSVLQYLKGETELNPCDEDQNHAVEEETLLRQVMKNLRLEKMAAMPVSNLSNGQTRRARIAKALLGKPELMLLDEPFMGLDPPTLVTLSPMLRDLAYKSSPRFLLALRPQDPIPNWITHLVILGQNHTVAFTGVKNDVLHALHRWSRAQHSPKASKRAKQVAQRLTEVYGEPLVEVGHTLTAEGIVRYEGGMLEVPAKKDFVSEFLSAPTQPVTGASSSTLHPEALEAPPASPLGDLLIELNGVIVKYGSKVVLGHPPPQPGRSSPGLHLTIRQGTRLALLGPNGSGKTTLLSLLTSDHPHSYSLPIKFFGRSRLPSPGKPGLSLWDIQSRVGHSSPEVHAFFPKRLPVRKVLESAWAETFGAKPKLNAERTQLVDAFLRWWEPELNHSKAEDSTLAWSQDPLHYSFGALPFGIQRLLLLLRALIKNPDIIILDEAFSGLSPDVREKAMRFLERGLEGNESVFSGMSKEQALIVVSHVREEIPVCVNEYVRLPGEEEVVELGKGLEMGRCDGGSIRTVEGWGHVWGL